MMKQKTKRVKTIKVKGWAIIPIKKGAKSINHFVDGIKCDYYGALKIPQFGIYPASVKSAKRRAEGNTNGYEKVIPIYLTYNLPK